MTKRSTRKSRGLMYYVGMGLSAGLFALVVIIGALAIVVPAITGSTPMTVLTGSMTPTYPPGTLVIVKPVDAGDIRIGDTITYQIESGKDVVVTHRVTSITSSSDGTISFITQGDANNTADSKPVIPDQIRGRVWYAIPYLGYVNTAVNGEARSWLVPLIAVGLFLYVGYLAASGIVDKVRKRRKDTESEAELAAEKTEISDTDAHDAVPLHGRRSAAR